MSKESEMSQIEARLAALEAKSANGTQDLNTDGLITSQEYDVGMPPIVPIGGSEGMFEWDGEKGQIGPGSVIVGRTAIRVAASNTGLGDGEWAVKVTFGENGDTAEIARSGTASDTVTYLPLYTIQDGAVVTDQRGNFYVQSWE